MTRFRPDLRYVHERGDQVGTHKCTDVELWFDCNQELEKRVDEIAEMVS